MSRSTPMLACALLVAGCATPHPAVVSAPRHDHADRTRVLSRQAPSLLQGESLQSASLASQLAEYELARRGVDCDGRRLAVSYCEGVYTVSFHALDRESRVETYTVDIRASDSRILRVTATSRSTEAKKRTGA